MHFPSFAEATVTARVLRGFDEVTQASGADAAKLLRRTNLQRADAVDPESAISFRAFCALLEEAARETCDGAFGLKFATHGSGPRGLVHLVMKSAPTIRDALAARVRFVRLLTNAYHLSMAADADGMGCLTWHTEHLGPRATQFQAYAVALVSDRVRQLTEGAGTPVRVELAQAPPARGCVRDAYEAAFDYKVSFNAPRSRLVFHKSLLNMVPATFDAEAHTELGRICLKLLGDNSKLDGFDCRISSAIAASLPLGAATERGVAKEIGVSIRTLQRILAARNTTFRALRDEIRRDLAKALLIDTDLPISEVAFRVGFSETSAFSRVATGWFGVAPSVYRRQRGGG